MVWLALEAVGRFVSWVVGLFRRDMENLEWERGAGANRLPPLGHPPGDGADELAGSTRSPGRSE